MITRLKKKKPWYVEKAQLAEEHNRPDLAIKIYENFKCFEEAITVAKKMKSPETVKRLCLEAVRYYEDIEDYEQAAVFEEKAGKTHGANYQLNEALEKYLKEDNNSASFRVMRKLWGIDKALERCEAECWFEELGDWHQEQGDTEKAKQYYEKEVEVRINEGLHKTAADVCLNKLKDPNRAADIYIQSGHFGEGARIQEIYGYIDAALVNFERAGHFLAAYFVARDNNRYKQAQRLSALSKFVN